MCYSTKQGQTDMWALQLVRGCEQRLAQCRFTGVSHVGTGHCNWSLAFWTFWKLQGRQYWYDETEQRDFQLWEESALDMTTLLLDYYSYFIFFKGYYSYKLVRQLMLIVRTWLHSQQTARRGNPNHAAVLRPGGDIRSACLRGRLVPKSKNFGCHINSLTRCREAFSDTN